MKPLERDEVLAEAMRRVEAGEDPEAVAVAMGIKLHTRVEVRKFAGDGALDPNAEPVETVVIEEDA
jgi:hypothetical protein